jgi:hypothetical protein
MAKIPLIDDPPINVQWDGKCFTIDEIRVDPLVLKEILHSYKFDENGNIIASINEDASWKIDDDDLPF